MIRPLNRNVLITPDPVADMTKSGFVIPDSAKKPTVSGTVAAIGPFVEELEVGDRVYFTQYSPDEVEVDGFKYLMTEEQSILAKETHD